MKRFSFAFAILILVTGCKKNDQIPVPEPVKPVVADTRPVMLKNIEAERLPSPYYHFEYDALHYVKRVSFASDYFVYDVSYQNMRVSKLINVINKDSLVYKYTDGQVSDIDEFSGRTGKLVFNYHLSYNSGKQLAQVFWYHYLDAGESFLYKRADLVYHPDGNLASIDWYYTLSPGPLNWSSRSEFSDYDSKTNSTDLVLLKENWFFDSYLFLPQVTLQKNNPKKEHITSMENEFFISNSYDYQNDIPIAKYSLVNQTKGTNPAPLTQVATHYSYY